MNVLVTGITGYVGSRLAPALARDGHAVRGFTRRSDATVQFPVTRGDLVSGEGLKEAFDGIDIAYFLIHSMETSPDGSFAAREHRAAENFAHAAREAGTGRIIYLGGLAPAASSASAHLRSRLEVERILLEASSCSVALRASIVIGAGSRSFRFLVRLVERLPVLAIPAWRTNRTAPVDERDMIQLLVRAATSDALCGQALDVGGRDTVTYEELIERIRDSLLLNRPPLRFRRLTLTPIVSRISAVIAGEDPALIGPLMAGLDGDLLPRDDRAARLLNVRLHSLDAAIEHALAEWEASESLAAR
jgi:uncharacterized protein YbjT (DUF2867 family)